MRLLVRLAVVALVAALAGCTGSASSPVTTAGAGGTASATASQPASTAPAASAASRAPSSATWTADSEAAVDALMQAIGNPDTGSTSDAFAAFELALKNGDRPAIGSTAAVVLGHLARARALLAPYLDLAAFAPAVGEWDALMAGVADGVARMRDGGLEASPAGIEAGRARMTEALRDHFYQAVYGPSSDRWRITWAWPDLRTVTPSRSRIGNEAGMAFDGNPDSFWTAGDMPAPQWIEIDLGRTVTITGVRLLTFQAAAGPSDHTVAVQGPAVASRELAAFHESTTDRQWLTYASPRPVAGIRVLRVTTLASPSNIGWREIEVLLAPESQLHACAAGTVNLALRRPATASASSPSSRPGLAVDGDPRTVWDAGGPAPQSIEVDLGRESSISSVRLLPAGAADAAIAVSVKGRDEAGHSMALGVINQAKTGSAWLTVAGPNPCVGLRWVSVETGWSVGSARWSEIEVLGAAGR